MFCIGHILVCERGRGKGEEEGEGERRKREVNRVKVREVNSCNIYSSYPLLFVPLSLSITHIEYPSAFSYPLPSPKNPKKGLKILLFSDWGTGSIQSRALLRKVCLFFCFVTLTFLLLFKRVQFLISSLFFQIGR